MYIFLENEELPNEVREKRIKYIKGIKLVNSIKDKF